jgi:YVTN family beta-propeller protein
MKQILLNVAPRDPARKSSAPVREDSPDHHEAVTGRCYICRRDYRVALPPMSVGRFQLRAEKVPEGEPYMSRKFFRDSARINRKKKSMVKPVSPLATLLAAGLGSAALAVAQSNPYPTYVTGPQPNGSWVVSSCQVITPAGTQVNLGIRVRAKAIALNPNVATHTAAVLTLGTSTSDGNGAVEVFDTRTGAVLQNYIPFANDPSGSYSGIAYSADGKYLVFSQDSSNVTIAKVTAAGLLQDDAQVSVTPNNSFISCFPNSPPAAYANPCGSFYSPSTSYPSSVALSNDGKSAYALLNQNNLPSMKVTATIPTDLHPTGTAFYGRYLLVAHTYSDTISVIDTVSNKVAWMIDFGLPIGVPGERWPAYGAAPNSIAVDAKSGIAYVALYHANAIAVVDVCKDVGASNPVMGMISVAYAPSSVVLATDDKNNDVLIVGNDHQWITEGMAPILFVMCDYVGGPPSTAAEQADNDLAFGRFIDYISHSNVWSSSAIFIEEDAVQHDADHTSADHTYYTQVNMTRTIDQILGLPPMNQFEAPNAFSQNPNGVGLGQGKFFFRGLSDGQYTLIFDGIRFEDTKSPTHHSWASLPGEWISSTDFERSPGLSSDFGPTNSGRSHSRRDVCDF